MVIEIKKNQTTSTNKQTNKAKSKNQNKLINNHHSASYFSSLNNRPITYKKKKHTNSNHKEILTKNAIFSQ